MSQYDIESDPTLTLSNQRVAEARAEVAAGTDRVYRIFTDGIFDLFHIGHMKVLKQAKYALGNPKNVHLIAGVCGDADTKKFKGTPVMDENTRVESVEHCKWVDEVIPHSPWVMTQEFMDKHQIDFVAHDAIPYVSAGVEDCYHLVKSQGKFLATERTEGISTTDIIAQIVRDYDAYVVRNLKRGVTKDDLNVGKTWEIRAVAHEKSRKIDENVDKIKAEKDDLIKKFKSLKDELKNTGAACTTSRKNKETTEKVDTGKICDEAISVVKHSWKLTVAVAETTFSVLGYFNIFSYIERCRQTRSYQQKKDE